MTRKPRDRNTVVWLLLLLFLLPFLTFLLIKLASHVYYSPRTMYVAGGTEGAVLKITSGHYYKSKYTGPVPLGDHKLSAHYEMAHITATDLANPFLMVALDGREPVDVSLTYTVLYKYNSWGHKYAGVFFGNAFYVIQDSNKDLYLASPYLLATYCEEEGTEAPVWCSRHFSING